MTDLSEKKLVVLASGGGSNFQSLIDSLQNDGSNIRISALVVDRPCQATQRARQHGIDYFEVNRHNDSHYNTQVLKTICQSADLIVCAGYLSILSAAFIAQFPEKIINIHPSLLPKFGGAGMYGIKVHQAAIAAGEKISGCTVHCVDAGVDTGKIIAQAKVDIDKNETAESLQKKVLVKEHLLLPAVVKDLLR